MAGPDWVAVFYLLPYLLFCTAVQGEPYRASAQKLWSEMTSAAGSSVSDHPDIVMVSRHENKKERLRLSQSQGEHA
jgi:hypothetical protein